MTRTTTWPVTMRCIEHLSVPPPIPQAPITEWQNGKPRETRVGGGGGQDWGNANRQKADLLVPPLDPQTPIAG